MRESAVALEDQREDVRPADGGDFELDEFSETAFDDLVRTTADLCQTPAAVIAIIVGERNGSGPS